MECAATDRKHHGDVISGTDPPDDHDTPFATYHGGIEQNHLRVSERFFSFVRRNAMLGDMLYIPPRAGNPLEGRTRHHRHALHRKKNPLPSREGGRGRG